MPSFLFAAELAVWCTDVGIVCCSSSLPPAIEHSGIRTSSTSAIESVSSFACCYLYL